MKKIFRKALIVLMLAMAGLSIASEVNRVDRLMKELVEDDD